MDKNLLKILGLIVGLIIFVGSLVYLVVVGFNIGPINAISVSGITEKREAVEKAKLDLEREQTSFDNTLKTLETTKNEFNKQKDAYELISDEKINAVKEATKEEQYMIEYIWITLGNYARKHDLEVAIVEPGGKAQSNQVTTTPGQSTDVTDVSTGTGITGNASGVTNTTTTPPKTNSNSSAEEDGKQTEPAVSVTTGLASSADALTVQIKGSYINLADFVFEVENDKSLRFRLDNIKMSSAGGTQVIASFNVKDFTVLKSLHSTTSADDTESLLVVE